MNAPGTGIGRQRDAGVLMHVTSLPGPFGIGDLGPAAHAWVDALAKAKQAWWQILPLGPPGAGDAPYNALSAFAGNPCLISPEFLVRRGLLRAEDLEDVRFPTHRVNFSQVHRFKDRLLAKAWERFKAGGARSLRPGLEAFRERTASWLEDYALFMALKEVYEGRGWIDWPKELAHREPAALREAQRELAERIDRHFFIQFLFDEQWQRLRRHARKRGVRLIGDLPIFISGESADVWAHPELFQLDADRRQTVVAGVPPDYFSSTGQLWGNPLYDWEAMRKQAYAWWVDRVRTTLAQVDAVRIDHFRGFESYWAVPADAPTAQAGQWVKASGEDLFRTLREQLGGLPFIAEDLGLITPEVEALRDTLDLPGMRVLQFAFGGGAESIHLPHNHVRNCVAYTGTHDNNTTAGWFKSLKARERRHVRDYLGHDDEPHWALTRLAWMSVADHAIVPAQDLIGLGSDARMNHPGRSSGNWRWRLREGELTDEHFGRLRDLTRLYGRTGGGS